MIGAALFLRKSCRRLEFFLKQLAFVEVGVFAVEGEELVVGAAFDDAAFGEDADEVGVADGRDAVRDDKRCAARADVAEVVEDFFFGVRVDGRKRIVEYQDSRVTHDCSSDGGSLLLSARERDAAFADELFVLAGKSGYVVREAGGLRRSGYGRSNVQCPKSKVRRSDKIGFGLWTLDFGLGAFDPESDVGGERVAEQESLLGTKPIERRS